jgi:hypothetical protein
MNLLSETLPGHSLIIPTEHRRNRTQPLFVDLGLAFGSRQIE